MHQQERGLRPAVAPPPGCVVNRNACRIPQKKNWLPKRDGKGNSQKREVFRPWVRSTRCHLTRTIRPISQKGPADTRQKYVPLDTRRPVSPLPPHGLVAESTWKRAPLEMSKIGRQIHSYLHIAFAEPKEEALAGSGISENGRKSTML